MQKQFLQLFCFHSVHRVSAHDAACLYGVAVSVEQRPHWGTQFKALTRIDVMQNKLCCFYSIHRVLAHDATYLSHVGACVKPASTWGII